MPQRPAHEVRVGWHVHHEGVWRLVVGVGSRARRQPARVLMARGFVEIELEVGLRRTEALPRPPLEELDTMKPDEWFDHVVAQRSASAASDPRMWGPVSRLEHGLPALPGGPAPRWFSTRKATVYRAYVTPEGAIHRVS